MLAVSAAMTAMAAGIPAPPVAAAVLIGAPGAFGIAPAPDSHGHVAPYFQITLAAGHSNVGTAIIRNQGGKTVKLRITPSTGTTAVNGGSAFSGSFHHCAGTGCWLTGLPGKLTLAANSQQRVNFTVRVPAGTAPGQYLAGISVEPAAPPRPVVVGSNGKASARAIIIDEVTVGVAVTVGSLPQLRTHLQITGVSAAAIGRIARLNISLANTGQTFAHGQGTASCSVAGKRRSAPFFAGTVLPHQRAVIAANAAGVPEGTPVLCRIRIVYGTGQVASWSGSVTVPDPPKTRIVHTGDGAYSVVPVARTPAWAIALIVVAGLAVAALVLLSVLLMRQRRRRSAF